MRFSLYHRYIKRLLDILAAITLLAITSWLFILIVVTYLVTRQLPVFFIQERIGKDERPFNLLKFRTLLADSNLPLEQRRFWLGNVLRRTSLDELPQLINILKGEMSLIGPRPLPVDYLPLYSSTQRQRHTVLPGITGWAQVNGRHSISWQQKFDLDLFYVKNVSFRLDFTIAVKTIVLILSFKTDKSLQEQRFTGSDQNVPAE